MIFDADPNLRGATLKERLKLQELEDKMREAVKAYYDYRRELMPKIPEIWFGKYINEN
jgi:hypothetical protein